MVSQCLSSTQSTKGALPAIVWHSLSCPIPSMAPQRSHRPRLVSLACLRPPSSTPSTSTTCICLAATPAPPPFTSTSPSLCHLNPGSPPPTVTWVGPHPHSNPSNGSLDPSSASAPRTFEPTSNRDVFLSNFGLKGTLERNEFGFDPRDSCPLDVPRTRVEPERSPFKARVQIEV